MKHNQTWDRQAAFLRTENLTEVIVCVKRGFSSEGDSLTEIRLDFDKCKYEIKSSRPISLPSPLTHIHMEIMQINDNLSILQKGVREAPNNYHLQGYFKN